MPDITALQAARSGCRSASPVLPCFTGMLGMVSRTGTMLLCLIAGVMPAGGQTLGNMAHRPVCRHFLRDRCKYGVFCRFRHELTPVRFCHSATTAALKVPHQMCPVLLPAATSATVTAMSTCCKLCCSGCHEATSRPQLQLIVIASTSESPARGTEGRIRDWSECRVSTPCWN